MEYFEKEAYLKNKNEMTEKHIIKMAAFKEELEKVSLDLGRAYGFGKLMGVGAAMGVAGSLSDWLFDKYKKSVQAKKAEEVFNKIYESSPSITAYPRDVAEEYFKSLVYHSPKLALEPISAKSHLASMIAWANDDEGVPRDIFAHLSNINKGYLDKNKPLSERAGINSSATSLLTKAISLNES